MMGDTFVVTISVFILFTSGIFSYLLLFIDDFQSEQPTPYKTFGMLLFVAIVLSILFILLGLH